VSTDKPPFDEATSGHLSMDEIADLDEGLLTNEQAEAAHAHLADCVECSDRVSALETSNAALRDLGPIAMPDDVATRIDAALAAEADAPATTPDAQSASNVTVMPDPSAIPRQRFRMPTAPAAAAAVVIVLAVVAIIVGHQHHHHNGITVQEAGGAAAQPPLVRNPSSGSTDVTPVSTGRVYDPNNLATYVPALLTASIPSISPSATTGAPSNDSIVAPGSTSGSTTSSGTGTQSYSGAASGPSRSTKKHGKGAKSTAGTLPTLTAPRAAAALTFNAAVPTELAHLYSDRAALLQCAAVASDTAGAVPLAVDFGRWRSPTAKPSAKPVPAIIFVFNSVQNSNTVDVFVVSASCDANSLLEYKTGIPK
jgi:negative regulator of sigma E activity